MDKKKLIQHCQAYDYIRFTFADINGTARGKVVPRRSVAKFVEDGLQMYVGTFAYGPNHEVPMKTLEAEIGCTGHGNCNLIPDPASFHPIKWSSKIDGGQCHKVAEVYCDPHWLDSNLPLPAAPRNVARKMLEKLDAMGLEILTGTEFKFKIYKDMDPKNRVPVFPLTEFGSMLRISLMEDLLYHLDSNLQTVGIQLENLVCEFAPGGFEMVLEPEKGIKAADNGFLFKQAVTEMVLKKGYGVSFLTKPDNLPGSALGAHFNFSIWDKSTGRNAFYDSDASDNLSATARHWIAGIVKHSRALAALCSPTINCYRRMHQLWAPDIGNWNYNDRNTFLRVKNEGEKSTYMENRVPSSAANPYVVMAATLAAGIDGVIHKMSPPVPHDANAPKMPSTLSEAINALEADTGLVDILGKDFVKYFIGIKREIDLEKFGHHDVSKFIMEELAAEISAYEITP